MSSIRDVYNAEDADEIATLEWWLEEFSNIEVEVDYGLFVMFDERLSKTSEPLIDVVWGGLLQADGTSGEAGDVQTSAKTRGDCRALVALLKEPR